MTKKWTYPDFEFALNSAWSAFGNTLRTHAITDNELHKFARISDLRGVSTEVQRALSDAITWKEEEE